MSQTSTHAPGEASEPCKVGGEDSETGEADTVTGGQPTAPEAQGISDQKYGRITRVSFRNVEPNDQPRLLQAVERLLAGDDSLLFGEVSEVYEVFIADQGPRTALTFAACAQISTSFFEVYLILARRTRKSLSDKKCEITTEATNSIWNVSQSDYVYLHKAVDLMERGDDSQLFDPACTKLYDIVALPTRAPLKRVAKFLQRQRCWVHKVQNRIWLCFSPN